MRWQRFPTSTAQHAITIMSGQPAPHCTAQRALNMLSGCQACTAPRLGTVCYHEQWVTLWVRQNTWHSVPLSVASGQPALQGYHMAAAPSWYGSNGTACWVLSLLLTCDWPCLGHHSGTCKPIPAMRAPTGPQSCQVQLRAGRQLVRGLGSTRCTRTLAPGQLPLSSTHKPGTPGSCGQPERSSLFVWLTDRQPLTIGWPGRSLGGCLGSARVSASAARCTCTRSWRFTAR
jgi:hypothetical protein